MSEKEFVRAVKNGDVIIESWEQWKPAPALKMIDITYVSPLMDNMSFKILVRQRVARKLKLLA